MDRRSFIRTSAFAAGAWLVTQAVPAGAAPGTPFQPHPLIRIDANGKITLFIVKQEMGQGVRTALPLLLAEELDADFDSIAVEALPYDAATAGRYNTYASASIKSGWGTLRSTGASVRAMLVAAAAAQWGVAPARCATAKGQVTNLDSGAVLSYASLIERASALPFPDKPTLKDPARYTLIGRKVSRPGQRALVSGRQQYGIDVRLPGMVYAVAVRAPGFHDKVRSVEDSAVRALGPGILAVVPLKAMGAGVDNRNGVAIVATSTWLALQGQAALKVEWERVAPPHASSAALFAALQQALIQAKPALTYDARGKSAAFSAISEAGVFSAEYEFPFHAHGAMEPLNCTAWYRDGKYELWGGFQAPGAFARELVKAFGVDRSAIHVHLLAMGGGFGRKEKVDNAAEAMQISKAVGKPVQLVFSRPDDTRNDFYRPASFHRLSAVSGRASVAQWRHQLAIATFPAKTISSPHDVYGGAAADLCYPVGEYQSAFYPVESPIPIGSWRSISFSHNVLAVECFIDELAAHHKIDPLTYRLALLKQGGPAHPHSARLEAVLLRCAEAIGWQRPARAKRFRGIACCVYGHAGAYAAHAFEISVAADKAIKIHRVVCAIDCGVIVDPQGFKAQVEGSLVWGLSAALKGEITVADGVVEQQSFGDCEVLRMHELPPLEIVIVASSATPGGAGEPAVPSVAPALCNAIAAATGKRMRQMPLQKSGYRLA